MYIQYHGTRSKKVKALHMYSDAMYMLKFTYVNNIMVKVPYVYSETHQKTPFPEYGHI